MPDTFCILRDSIRSDQSWCGRDTRNDTFRFPGVDGFFYLYRNGSPIPPCPACVKEAAAGFVAAASEVAARGPT